MENLIKICLEKPRSSSSFMTNIEELGLTNAEVNTPRATDLIINAAKALLIGELENIPRTDSGEDAVTITVNGLFAGMAFKYLGTWRIIDSVDTIS